MAGWRRQTRYRHWRHPGVAQGNITLIDPEGCQEKVPEASGVYTGRRFLYCLQKRRRDRKYPHVNTGMEVRDHQWRRSNENTDLATESPHFTRRASNLGRSKARLFWLLHPQGVRLLASRRLVPVDQPIMNPDDANNLKPDLDRDPLEGWIR